MNHFRTWAFRSPIDCQAIYNPSRKPGDPQDVDKGEAGHTVDLGKLRGPCTSKTEITPLRYPLSEFRRSDPLRAQ